MWYSGVEVPTVVKSAKRVLFGTMSRRTILFAADPSIVTATGAASPVPVLERLSVKVSWSPGAAVVFETRFLAESADPGAGGVWGFTLATLEVAGRVLSAAGEN